MNARGFTNHTLMGAAFLGGVWIIIHLPQALGLVKAGGWMAGVAIAAVAIGAIGCPILLVMVEGDEGFGCLGLIAALVGGFASSPLAESLKCSPGEAKLLRLCCAALLPVILFLGFHLLTREKGERNAHSG